MYVFQHIPTVLLLLQICYYFIMAIIMIFKLTTLHQDINLTHLILTILNLVSCLILAWVHNGLTVIYPGNNRLYKLEGLHVS